MGLHVARERSGLDLAIHRPPDEAHARRDVHGELHFDVVIVDVHASAGAGLAFVGTAPVARRINRADGDAIGVRHGLHSDGIWIAVTPALDGLDGDFHARGALGVNGAVDALNLDRLARSDA